MFWRKPEPPIFEYVQIYSGFAPGEWYYAGVLGGLGLFGYELVTIQNNEMDRGVIMTFKRLYVKGRGLPLQYFKDLDDRGYRVDYGHRNGKAY
jgi:hypothetical protein